MTIPGSVMRLLAATLWCAVSMGCAAEQSAVEVRAPEKLKPAIVDVKQTPIIDLYWKRPANSFVMVESRNDSVCNEFLNAINEERDHVADGDIDGNKSIIEQPKANMDIPELIIQTKYNLPRKEVIKNVSQYAGVRRGEEYAVDINMDGVTEYAYRTTGVLSSTPIHWPIVISETPFVSEGSEENYVDFIRKLNGGTKLDDPKWYVKFPWHPSDGIFELVSINSKYYIAYTQFGVRYGTPIEVTLSHIEKDYTANQQCSMKTVFTVSKH